MGMNYKLPDEELVKVFNQSCSKPIAVYFKFNNAVLVHYNPS